MPEPEVLPDLPVHEVSTWTADPLQTTGRWVDGFPWLVAVETDPATGVPVRVVTMRTNRDYLRLIEQRRELAKPLTMTRDEANSHIWGLESSVAAEFYVGGLDHAAGDRETRAALRALGVTDREHDLEAVPATDDRDLALAALVRVIRENSGSADDEGLTYILDRWYPTTPPMSPEERAAIERLGLG